MFQIASETHHRKWSIVIWTLACALFFACFLVLIGAGASLRPALVHPVQVVFGWIDASQQSSAERDLRSRTHKIEQDPGNPDVYIERGKLAASVGRPQDAIADFTRAIRLNPNATAAYVQRARVLLFIGRMEEAVADQNRVRDLEQPPAIPAAMPGK